MFNNIFKAMAIIVKDKDLEKATKDIEEQAGTIVYIKKENDNAKQVGVVVNFPDTNKN